MINTVSLRELSPDDLPLFFEQQLDPAANHQAAATVEDPADRAAFDAHWVRILHNPEVKVRTILVGEQVAGYVASFVRFGEPEVSYWLGREYWGGGVATRALAEFLEELPIRPIYGRAAVDNVASVRVLAKCGFVESGRDRFFSHSRGHEVEEVILKLTANEDPSGL
jgi:RimJ/RimL family protein N-acetyltransferase